MNILIHSFGTVGDEQPFIALGTELQKRGHSVRMLMNPAAERRCRGLSYRAIGDRFDVDEIVSTPRAEWRYLRSPRAGKFVVRDFYLPNTLHAYQAVTEELAQHSFDLVVSHFMCFGSSWAARNASVRYINVSLAPFAWLSLKLPPVLTPRILPKWLNRWLVRLARKMMNRYVGRPMARARRQLGLEPDPNPYFDHFRLAAGNLALWSPTLRSTITDDPPNSTICGFTLGTSDKPLDDDLRRFLDAGEPPVVVGLGSSTRTAGDRVYTYARAACRKLGTRCVLVGARDAALQNLTATEFAIGHVPYEQLFPLASAIIHPAGAGTTAEALRSGRPSIAIPFVNDQFDNATLAARLGSTIRIARARLRLGRVTAALRRVLHEPSYARVANDVRAALLAENNGAHNAADYIETFERRQTT